MMTEPQVEDLQAQPYVAINTQTTLQALGSVLPQLLGEVFAWLAKQGVASAGPPFIRYLVIDMKAVLDIEVGVSVANANAGDDRIHAGVLPAGRYATLIYTGVKNGIESNKALLDWGAKQGLTWESWQVGNGEGFGGRFEFFLTDPNQEPDQAKWETRVAIRLAA